MTEADVVRKICRFLRASGLAGQPVVRLFADAHPTLLPYADLQPFQRFTLELGDLVLYPDLVRQLADGETILRRRGQG
jgi:hypothetical protein